MTEAQDKMIIRNELAIDIYGTEYKNLSEDAQSCVDEEIKGLEDLMKDLYSYLD